MSRPIVVASNVYNEIEQCEGWFENVYPLADGGMLIVDPGSTDGTTEFFEKKVSEGFNVVLIKDDDDIIRREGYGPARSQLRELSAKHFPDAVWMIFLDFDERIDPKERHMFRAMKDNISDEIDVIALVRLNCLNEDCSETKYDYHVQQDWQARMTRLDSPLRYIRKVHEQIVDYKKMHTDLMFPKIQHFHKVTDQEKRDHVGRLCAKLHKEDKEFGHTVPEHHKEEMYYKQYLERGL